jgi:hypothetical protein
MAQSVPHFRCVLIRKVDLVLGLVQSELHGRVGRRAEAKSSDEPLTSTDVTVRRLENDAVRRRLAGGRTAGSF